MWRIMILLFLVSCGKKEVTQPRKNLFRSFREELVPSFKTHIQIFNFNQDEAKKIQSAAKLIEQVLRSEEFRDEILNHEINGKKTFHLNQGLSNEDIYKKIMQGSEKLTAGKDYEMDLTIEGYEQDSSIIGYTFPNTIKIWMNKKFLAKFRPHNVTGNMIHEWLHKLGFEHEFQYAPMRRHSVPYAVGYIVEKLAKMRIN